jgi:protein-disulfide isomerase
METPQKLTKAEKRELKKLEWQEKLEKEKKAQQYKKISLWIGVGVVVVLGILGLAWLVNSPASQNTTSALSAPAVSKEDLFTFGNPKAKVVLTEYGDYQCPACKAYAPIVKQLIEEKQKDILFVYRYFPLVNVHQNAKISAQAGWAANKQGKFWEMSEALYANQRDSTKEVGD